MSTHGIHGTRDLIRLLMGSSLVIRHARRIALRGCACAGLGLLSLCATAWAQWLPAGTPVTPTLGAHEAPAIASDGSGGAIVVWGDMRSTDSPRLYAQRFDGQGLALWPQGGVRLSTAEGEQIDHMAVPSGNGDVVVLWLDLRSSYYTELYAQKLDASGNPLWASSGAPVRTGPTGLVSLPALAADSAGGLIAAWSSGDIYAQRLDSNGSAVWAGSGVPVCTLAETQYDPVVVADGTGGAFVAWKDTRDGLRRIYAQRLTSAGVPTWAVGGIPVTPDFTTTMRFAATADGAGGLVIAWCDNSVAYAQRFDAIGEPQWGAGGVSLGTGATEVKAALGGSCMLTFVFDGARDGGDCDVFAQRLDSEGIPQWASGGVMAVTWPGEGQYPVGLDVDASGVTVVLAYSWEGTNRVQRIEPGGTVAWGDGGVGLIVAGNPQLATDNTGGCIVAWARDVPAVEGVTRRDYVRRIPAAGAREVTLAWSAGGHTELLEPTPICVPSANVTEFEVARFRFAPDFGYYINDVTLDGVSQGVPPNLELAAPTTDHALYAGFSNGTWFEPSIATPRGAYAGVAFPLAFTDDSLSAVLGELGPFDDTAWRLARWDPDSLVYAFGGAGLQTLEAGAGYWLITVDGAQITADGKPLTADTVGVKLLGTATSGWNQIANPFRFPIADTALRVLGNGLLERFTDGANTLTDALVWEWKGGANYDSVRTLQPRRVYWVRKNVSAPVNLVFPNWSSEVVSPGPATLPASAEWTVALTARQGEVSSMRVLAGRWARTAQGEALRLEAPPGSPDGGLSLRLGEAASGGAGRIADFTRDDGPWRWEIELSGAEAPGEIVLECEASSLPAGMRLWLSDEARNWSQELTPGDPVTLAATAGVRRLHLHASIAGEIPGRPGAGARLAAAYPNPFRDRIGLVLQLPRASAVVVTVFDVQGRQVRSFATETLAPGEHVLVWDGRDAGGRAMPGGVYLARCEAAGGRGTARIMKLH